VNENTPGGRAIGAHACLRGKRLEARPNKAYDTMLQYTLNRAEPETTVQSRARARPLLKSAHAP